MARPHRRRSSTRATRAPGAQRAGTGGETDVVDLARRLGAVIAELALCEVEIEHGDLRIRVQRAPLGFAADVSAPGSPPAPVGASSLPAGEAGAGALVTVEAPMVGTFYRASSPTADPYVREGDLVKHGQILCIIEAMKLMNEIESKVSGRIVKILVENGQPVEYGQPLFLIDPR
ncbi:MAG: acetyl-CoA carboxylase biotin carboxyl carrier protein [Candidatus Rokubacteria bacterium]|nr:acetyl-CoA carboxylase biotin carboxyl carrier protein [Candidatus Rokubacteria bacterium]